MSITPQSVAKQLSVFIDMIDDQLPSRSWTVDLDIDNGFALQTEVNEDEEFDDDVFGILEYDTNPVIFRKEDSYDILLSADDDLISLIVRIHDPDIDMEDFPDKVISLLPIDS